MSPAANHRELARPIPLLVPILGWQNIPVEECGEPLVALSDLKSNRIVQLATYFHNGFSSANSNLYVRAGVGQLLISVAANLPDNLHLAVFDAWRSQALQQELFNKYLERLRQSGSSASEHQLVERAKRYVSLPAIDPDQPAPHVTGGSVDLTLSDMHGCFLPMGTDFDHFGPEAATRHFEEQSSSHAELVNMEPLSNRRLLFNLMTNHGFTNYSEEWWHFDYGNQFWAQVTGGDAHAKYGPTSPP